MAGPARNAGYVNYNSGGTVRFIPEIWSGKLVEKFYLSTVFGDIANTDYEGEIKSVGDSVVIRTVPDVAISDYTIGGGLTYEQLTSDAVTLDIDRAKYFAFSVNDIDAYQSDLEQLNRWSTETSNKMKIACDRDVLGSIYADANAKNAGLTAGRISGDINLGTVAAPLVFTKTNAIEVITELGLVLDEFDIPEEGRWVIIPSWSSQKIKISDLMDASVSGDRITMARNGRIGMLDRFTVYMSNNLSVEAASTKTHIVFGYKAGLTWASQMTKMEDLKNPDDFDMLIRGLNVYGFETINDTCIGHAVFSKT